MATINQTFKKGQEYVFSISEIPEINTDNVRIVQCTDLGSMLDCRIINDTTIGLTYNQSNVNDFTSTINLVINGVRGYDDYDVQIYDGTQNILEIRFQINGEVQKIPFILVNNGDSPVTIIMEKNNAYNYADDKIWHCEGLEEGTYSNDVTVNNNLITIGTIPAHQKMFMKTTLDSFHMYKIQEASSSSSYPINIKFNNGTDFTNITFEGDIMALVNYNFYGVNNRLKPNFHALFKDITTLKVTPSLSSIVNMYGDSTYTDGIFSEMFSGCTSLTTITDWPNKPYGAYGYACYQMFNGCSALVDASMITLKQCYASHCYESMFQGCTSLTTAPELTATQLTPLCYAAMFYNCTSLTTVPKILPATSLQQQCYDAMFENCSSLVTAPELPATTLAKNCYESMFYNCTSLTTAPVLPATTLVTGCYKVMFLGCSKLNYIKALFTTTPSDSYTVNWVNGVASTGKFVKNNEATWDVTGTNGIPSGWTVITELEDYNEN